MSVVQIINILTIGSPTGIGGFYPQGLNGNIKTPTGYNVTASGLQPFAGAAQDVEVHLPAIGFTNLSLWP